MSRWLVLALLASAGCRQVAGIDDRSAQGGACGALAGEKGACSACLAGNCCDEARACSGDAACAKLFSCLDACAGSDACRSDCRTAHPAGFSEVGAALAACQAKACASSCGASTCGGYVFSTNVCAACATSSCCSQATACATDAECTALAFCARSCGDDLTCASRCSELHPAGWEAEQRFAGCVKNQCDVVCGSHGWDCVGSVEWPTGVGSVKWSLTLRDFVKDVPLPGVSCMPCRRSDPTCSDPLMPAKVTDDQGQVTFDLPAGFDGYADASGAGIYPSLFFPAKPLVADTVQGANLLTAESFPVLAALLGAPDPERGHLSLGMSDCTGAPAAHVAFEASPLDADSIPFYLLQNLPSKTAKETDKTGLGGFGNVPPGAVTVRALVSPIGLKASEATVLVRKGTFTYKPLVPSP